MTDLATRSVILLTDDDIRTLDSGHCPDCNGRGFILGPRGGVSINIKCANLDCRSRFNVASPGWSHRISFAQRIPSQADGGADWSE
jgi:hypothetical protein